MSQLRTLIIDDNPSDRALALRELKKLFPHLQYREILEEKDFTAALEEDDFNLVITDYQLLWITGLEILSRVKQAKPDCPVVMFTGTGSEEIAVSAMKAGLDDYVIKTPRHYVRLAAAVRSVWQRFQQKQALEEFKQSYYRFFERVPLGLYRLDSAGAVLEANSTLMAMLGYSLRQDLQGEKLQDRHLNSKEYLQWLRQLGTKEAVAEFEGQVEQVDGELIWVRHQAIAVRDAGRIVCYEGAVANITASKQAELERTELLDRERQARKEAETANRIKDEFLATLSHELRTPLNAIVGWTQLLLAGRMDESQIRKALGVIDRNARAQNQLVDDLLDVSSIIRGTVNLEFQPVDLMEVVWASLDTVAPAAKAKNLQIITELETSKLEVNGDRERLQQIFWNLAINAVKFTDTGGKITVLSRVNDGKVTIEVRDTGRGIAAEVLPYVFDRFRQAETKSSTRTKGGLGLGLAIVRHLVELHGGEVMADSKGKGKGAVFTVELPLLLDINGKNFSTADTSSLNTLALKDLKLLIVEDEPDARDMLLIILQQYGASVTATESVEEALMEYARNQPDILISDISMPDRDGFTLIQKIRNSDTLKSNLPAIALTAYASQKDRQRILASGFDLHLAKPIEPELLITSIRSLINSP